MKRFLLVSALVLVGGAALVYAGSGYRLNCPEEACEYEGMVTFGGGRMFEQKTAYCCACKKFVYLRWSRGGRPGFDGKVKLKPEPLGQVWDSATGRVLTLYACPECQAPAAEIPTRKDLKVCPQCNKGHFDLENARPAVAID